MNRRTRLVVLALVAALLAIPVMVSSASAADPTTVSITKDRSYYVAGQSAQLTVVTSGTGSGKALRVTVSYANGATRTVSSGATDDTFTFEFGMYINSTIRADVLDGDTVVATDEVTMPVRAKLGTRAFGYHQKYGSYLLYPRGSSPSFRSAIEPVVKGSRCLRHVVQRRYASGWKNVFTSACRVQDSKGRVDWTWRGKHASGVRFRVRATFAGDSLNRANAGNRIYFKFR